MRSGPGRASVAVGRRYRTTVREHGLAYAARVPPLVQRLSDHRAVAVDHIHVAARPMRRAEATLRRATPDHADGRQWALARVGGAELIARPRSMCMRCIAGLATVSGEIDSR